MAVASIYRDLSINLKKEGLITDEKVVLQRLKLLLTTEPGDLIDLPTFGTPLTAFLYEGMTEGNMELISMVVERSITDWLGEELRIDNIKVIPNFDTNEIAIELGLYLKKFDRAVGYTEIFKA